MMAHRSMSIDEYGPVSSQRGTEVTSFDKLSAVTEKDPSFTHFDRFIKNEGKFIAARRAKSRHGFFGQSYCPIKQDHPSS